MIRKFNPEETNLNNQLELFRFPSEATYSSHRKQYQTVNQEYQFQNTKIECCFAVNINRLDV